MGISEDKGFSSAGGTPAAGSAKKHALPYVLALVLFGSNGVIASYIALSSYEIVLLRSLLGSLLLAGLFLLSGRRITALHHPRDLVCILCSGAAMAADWLLLFEAYARMGVGLSMVVNYCGPAIVVALSVPLFRQRLPWKKALALAAALAGAFLISGAAGTQGGDLTGLLCAVLSAFAYAGMVLCSKLTRHVKGMEHAALQLFAATATVVIFVGLRQGLYVRPAPSDWLPILWLGLVNTGLACFFYFSSIGALPVQTVAVCGYLEPLAAVVLAALILGERMQPLQLCGGALILGGAIFSELSAGKKRRCARTP